MLKLNYQGEVHEIWTSALNKEEAFDSGIAKLARTKGRTVPSMRNYFLGKPNSCEVIEK